MKIFPSIVTLLIVVFFLILLFITWFMHTMFYKHIQKEKSNNYYYFLKLRVHYIPQGNFLELGNTPLKLNPFRVEVLGRNYIKDSKRVYYKDILIEWADAQTFVLLDEEMYARDASRIYIYGIPFKNLDPETFQKDEKFSNYVRDKQYIYYVNPGDISRNRRNYTSIEALPLGYNILINEYGTLDGFLYYQGKKIENSYAEHFEVLETSLFPIIKTPNYINYLWYMVYNADIPSFEVLNRSFYFRDINGIYFWFQEIKNAYTQTIGLSLNFIPEADKDSFEVMLHGKYFVGKDKNHLYESGKIIPSLDAVKGTDINAIMWNLIPQ